MAYRKAQVAVTNSQWTPIAVSNRIAGWALKSSSATDFLISTNPNDPSAQDSVPGANQEVCDSPKQAFLPDEILVYAKSTVASDTLVLTYITSDF